MHSEGSAMFPKPMVLDGVVFRARSHETGIQTIKSQCTSIIFMHRAVDIRCKSIIKANYSIKLMDEGHMWEEIVVSRKPC
jgi:hypothetical protein